MRNALNPLVRTAPQRSISITPNTSTLVAGNLKTVHDAYNQVYLDLIYAG